MELLLDYKQLDKILSDYHRLLGVGIGLYDKYYQPICLMPKTNWSFCNIIRQNKDVLSSCYACDKKAFEHVNKTKKLYIYKCHMGLYEAVAPIIDNDVIIGYIMVGQLLDQQSLKYQWVTTSKKCNTYGFEVEEIKDAFFNLRQMSHSDIESAANIMHACSAYLCYQNIVHVERGGLFGQIHQFLTNNIKEKITQDIVCSHLNISKSTLYNTLIEHTSMSLTSYVRKLRMGVACELLTNTNLKINKIAEEVGIEDYNYFSRQFKDTYGITPRLYRSNQNPNG